MTMSQGRDRQVAQTGLLPSVVACWDLRQPACFCQGGRSGPGQPSVREERESVAARSWLGILLVGFRW